MGTLVVSLKENAKYKFTYNNRKGNTIFSSNSFLEKESCFKNIQLMKENFNYLNLVRLKTSSGKLYFKALILEEIVGQSRKFTTSRLIEKAIEDFLANFTKSEILDFTENIFELQPQV